MTEFGDLFFATIIVAIIGLIIQYYIIKAAVYHGVKKYNEETKPNEKMIRLLEIIAAKTAIGEEWNQYVLKKRTNDYNKQREQINYHTSGNDRKRRMEELDEEYKDVLDLEN